MFRNLLKISNVGPRIALGVLSGMSVDGFYQCIRNKDLGALTKIPGVGKKTAERLLIEMADRLPESGRPGARGVVRAELVGRRGARRAVGARLQTRRDREDAARSRRATRATEELIREALRRVHRAAERLSERHDG